MALHHSILPNSIEVNKPFLSTDDAVELFLCLYNLDGARQKPILVKNIDGYRGQNFLITLGRNDSDACRYVMKVLSGLESKAESCFLVIHRLMKYLKQHNYLLAAPMQNIYGDDVRLQTFSKIQPQDSSQHPGQAVHGQYLIKAYPFIDGVTLTDIVPSNLTHILYEAGKLLAKFHKITQNFSGDIEPLKRAAERNEFSLHRVNLMLHHLDVVKDDARRNLVKDVIMAFETKVLAKQSAFRKGILHNDFSHTNLVIVPECGITENNNVDGNLETKTTNYKLNGVIDFDDCQYNCYVYDVAISMMYLSLSKAAGNQPLQAAAAFLAGYQQSNPLTQKELEVLHVCQAARYVQSMVIGLYTSIQQPGNDYILQTQIGWPVLENLWSMEPEKVWKLWQDVADECREFEKYQIIE